MTTEITKVFLDHGIRFDIPKNSVGLTGLDHVGMAVRDPLKSAKFIEQVLGGVEVYRAGWDAEDIKLGRPQHIFFHVGTTLIEIAKPKDDKSYPDLETLEPQPHWAFGTTAEGLLQFADHLTAQGVPFDGPRSHRGMSAVSVYFRDPDGNNLEATTWEEVPEDKVTPMGGPFGFPNWPELLHNWTPRD
ncbi:VOC family protein [Streptomyces blattellae]|uniref:VOC family protein n=1 Tax=Streptomyces blattellae TaxID=2569855 RepID=UPI0012B9D54C|nr:VOC family protein [Streptomyces blattellae]